MTKTRQVEDEVENEREQDARQYVEDIGVCKEIALQIFPGVTVTPELAHAFYDALPPLEDENQEEVEKAVAVIKRCATFAGDDPMDAFKVFDCLPTDEDGQAQLDEDLVSGTLAVLKKCLDASNLFFDDSLDGVLAIFDLLPEDKSENKVFRAAGVTLAALEACAEAAKELGIAGSVKDVAFGLYVRIPQSDAGKLLGGVEDILAGVARARDLAREVHGKTGAELVFDIYDRLFADEEGV